MNAPRAILNTKEVAEITGLEWRVIRERARSGRFEAVDLGNGRGLGYRFTKATIEAFILRREHRIAAGAHTEAIQALHRMGRILEQKEAD